MNSKTASFENRSPSRQELIEALKESKLLRADEMARAETLEPDSDGLGLARALGTANILTKYQIDALLHRRLDKLHIGTYDVLAKLGTGDTGSVFRVVHRRMKRVVALRVLARKLCRDEGLIQKFRLEVESLAQVSHPNVVMTYESDHAAVGHFVVMEHIQGRDLGSIVQEHGPLGLVQAVDCTLQAARGLAHVHAHGLVHRDVKPANLLREESGLIKVSDLGVARLSASVSAVDNGLTQTRGALRTVDYMAPEQAIDALNFDQRSDIYGLGASLYYLLAGTPVYPGQTMMETLLKHRDAPIPSLADRVPGVPPDLDMLTQRMLAKSVHDRIQSMAEVVAALEAIKSTMGQEVTTPVPAEVLPEVEEVPTANPRETISVPRSVNGDTTELALNSALQVLLVEPSRTQAAIVRKYLQSQNIHQVTLVATGAQALSMLRRDPPGAIISALYLADMTGADLARQVHAERPSPAPGFVLMAGKLEGYQAFPPGTCGPVYVLEHPFTPQQLMQALSTATGQVLAVTPATPEEMGLSLVKSPAPPTPGPGQRSSTSRWAC